MNLEKAYNKWQCTDIEEKYINNIEPTQFTKSELFSFAEFYHQSKVNNGVLDDVSNTLPDHVVKFRLEELEMKYNYLMEQLNKMNDC